MLVLGSRSYLPTVGPVVLGMDQPNLALADYMMALVVLHLDLPKVEPALLGWGLPMLELGLVERRLALGSYSLGLDSC